MSAIIFKKDKGLFKKDKPYEILGFKNDGRDYLLQGEDTYRYEVSVQDPDVELYIESPKEE